MRKLFGAVSLTLSLSLLCLASTACSGGLLAVQRNVEAQGHPVDRVGVRHADGKKVVTVYTERKVSKSEKEDIKRIALETIPDASEVKVKKAEPEERASKPTSGSDERASKSID